uniref:Uncharacterized protein n=1 Tax=Romanomermis culicivorax TaxID=13658 RepID=A0A915K8Z7_ROMCU
MGYMILFGIRCNIGAAKVSGAHNHKNETILVEDADLLILEYDYDDDQAMIDRNDSSIFWSNSSQKVNISSKNSNIDSHFVDDLKLLSSTHGPTSNMGFLTPGFWDFTPDLLVNIDSNSKIRISMMGVTDSSAMSQIRPEFESSSAPDSRSKL